MPVLYTFFFFLVVIYCLLCLYYSFFRMFYFNIFSLPGNVGDVIAFPLADIGEGITECEVLEWFVKEGQAVKQFDNVCEVQSDKANVGITSRYDGVVEKIMYAKGETAIVGKPLIMIRLTTATAGAAPKSDAPAATTACPAATASASTPAVASGDASDVLASPVVRRMARELNIDLGKVAGTGSKGQITKDDLLNFQSTAPSSTPAAAPATTAASAPAAAAASATASVASPFIGSAKVAAPEDRKVAVTGIQKAMVKSMTAAVNVPTLGFADEINVDRLIKIRALVKDSAARHGVKLTFLPFIIKAVSLSLSEYPAVNSTVNTDCSEITVRGSHNIGVAMDTPKGLLVPNVKNVQNLSVLEIAAELNRLQLLASQGKLGSADLSGATFTLSNIGSVGGTYCNPVLVVPQVMIGAIGRFNNITLMHKNGSPYASSVMNLSWTADHRALDGATVARFSNQVKAYLENPETMVLF